MGRLVPAHPYSPLETYAMHSQDTVRGSSFSWPSLPAEQPGLKTNPLAAKRTVHPPRICTRVPQPSVVADLIEHPGGTFEGANIGSNTVNPPAAINAGTLTIVGPKAVNPPATKTETTGAIIANGGYTVTIGPTFTTNDIDPR